MQDILFAALLLWALAIAVIDWRLRKVPNALLLLLLVPAVVMLGLQGRGLNGAAPMASAYGLVAGFILTLPGYLTHKLGAGDVKLAAVIGFVLGWPLALWAMLGAALLLGAMSLAVVRLFGLTDGRAIRVPAAVALAGGFAATLLAQRGGWL